MRSPRGLFSLHRIRITYNMHSIHSTVLIFHIQYHSSVLISWVHTRAGCRTTRCPRLTAPKISAPCGPPRACVADARPTPTLPLLCTHDTVATDPGRTVDRPHQETKTHRHWRNEAVRLSPRGRTQSSIFASGGEGPQVRLFAVLCCRCTAVL